MRRAIWILTVLFLIGTVSLVWMVQPIGAVAPSFDELHVSAELLESHVRTLSERFVPRDSKHPENLERVANYLAEKLRATTTDVELQSLRAGGNTYYNVIARFDIAEKGGSTPRVVIGAHYDSAGPLPGADDNASGVAGLLELAGLLKRSPLNHPIELVAYTLEEPPYFTSEAMGSVVHAKSLRAKGIQVSAMLSLEMIGYFSDAAGSQKYPVPGLDLIYPSVGNFIAVAGDIKNGLLTRKVKAAMRSATPLPVHSISAPSWVPGVDLSDHRSYWSEGYPAVMITDTAFVRNFAYHTSNDTAERLDYARMGMVVEGVYKVIKKLR